jgi:hypothetical protein
MEKFIFLIQLKNEDFLGKKEKLKAAIIMSYDMKMSSRKKILFCQLSTCLIGFYKEKVY